METIHVDVLVVGAGVSGIGAACRLQERCPGKSYAILEAREKLGGTWDLFRYPGIRSDSDMYTFAYPFRPWNGATLIADGASILAYLEETAAQNGIQPHIRYRQRARQASWSSETALWTVNVDNGADQLQYTCRFLYMCAGYYNYAQGYTPEFADVARFRGRIVHPQQWTRDIEYTGKRVVVIGSGATAITLVPELAAKAGHVTMLQRSPSYLFSWPSVDRIGRLLRRLLPFRLAHAISRGQYLLLMAALFRLSRAWPTLMKRLLIRWVRNALGPGHDVARHFTPRYGPWQQRMCLVPDGDLFEAMRSGRASVVTDRIAGFTERGIKLESGDELEADLIVTATGLDLQMFGGMKILVDGAVVDIADTLQYKGMMFSGIPNFASCFGYTNASWTLKADLISEHLCRILKYMDRTGCANAFPNSPMARSGRNHSSIFLPAISSGPATAHRSKVRSGRGSSTRTTRSTSRCSAWAGSPTAHWYSPIRSSGGRPASCNLPRRKDRTTQ